jgi:hypothetical protein
MARRCAGGRLGEKFREFRQESMFIDCTFQWWDPRGNWLEDECGAHKLVVRASSQFWQEVFNDDKIVQDYPLPLDILYQFKVLVDLWYDERLLTPR